MSEASPVPLELDRAPVQSGSRWRSAALAGSGLLGAALVAVLVMGARPGLPGGFFIGLFATCAAALSGLWLSLAFAPAAPIAREVSLTVLRWPALAAAGSLASLWLVLRLAVAGVLPLQEPLLAVLVPGLFMSLVSACAVVLARLGFLADPERPLLRRHGFWLVLVTTLLYLPMLGNFGLIDPWEPHYAEVAREMLARDDWISLWWVQDGWFWSKPIGNFWAQGLSFLALGVAWAPDHMIQGLAMGRTPAPEWAVRLPVFGMALLGQLALYFGARAYVGRLSAFLGVLVLATTPYWSFLAHQSMADMAYVGPLCAAMGLLLLALRAGADARVSTVAIARSGGRGPLFAVSGYHLLFAGVLLLALPQVFYLVSRNLSLEWGDGPWRLRLHLDEVMNGSPGNCGVPSNAPCRVDAEASRVALQPAGAALIWASAGALLLWLRRGERRSERLYYLGAWLFTGLSFMGKGAPGLVLALFTFGAFLFARGRLRELVRADWLGFGLLTMAVVLPWFVQEYLRHGREFFERLFIHDMYLRAFDHVHDTNKGDDTSFRYYVWQLGYGLFPWSGLGAAGTLACLGGAFAAKDAKGPRPSSVSDFVDLVYFCALWQLAAFGMFTITGTKFHHYILPLVPPIAILTGVMLASLWRGPGAAKTPDLAKYGLWALGAAVLVWLAGRDLATSRPGDVRGAARLVHLFSYNYARSWPRELDYSVVLWVFTGLAVLACLLAAWPRLWRASVAASCGVAVMVTAWLVNVYLVQISPHWGQRETVGEYYLRRAGPEEPLVAYQLNWKGENFYTGNKAPVFVSSGRRFTDWVEAEKKRGTKVMFFTTEHSRLGSLKRELSNPREFQELTDERLNDKFALVRVVL